MRRHITRSYKLSQLQDRQKNCQTTCKKLGDCKLLNLNLTASRLYGKTSYLVRINNCTQRFTVHTVTWSNVYPSRNVQTRYLLNKHGCPRQPYILTCACTNGYKVFITLRSRLNSRYFQKDTLKCIFLNGNAWISIKIQLTIFQYWFREWLGAGQATSHCLNQWWLIYDRHSASISYTSFVNDNWVFKSYDCSCVILRPPVVTGSTWRNAMPATTMNILPDCFDN